MKKAGLFVEYCAKDFLDGCNVLDAWQELAYRRVCDLIYATNDNLIDDDRKLSWQTKTGRRWKSIKAVLVSLGKIWVEDGKIRNQRCITILAKNVRRIAQKSSAGKASFERRKSLGINETSPTDVGSAVVTAASTNPLNQESTKPRIPPESPPLDAVASAVDREFEEWWLAYPEKQAKGAARKAYQRARRRVDSHTLLTGLSRYKRVKPDDRHWAYPATWLNQERWLDAEPLPLNQPVHRSYASDAIF